MVKKAIESLYSGKCDVYEYQAYTKANKSTGHKPVKVMSDIKCRLSFKTLAGATDGNASGVSQTIKLFIAPDISIKTGSKIVVTQNGKTTAYKNSGQPAVYSNHQEIMLELFEGWA